MTEPETAHDWRLLGTRLKGGEVGLMRHLTVIPQYFFRCRNCGRVTYCTLSRAAERGWIDVEPAP